MHILIYNWVRIYPKQRSTRERIPKSILLEARYGLKNPKIINLLPFCFESEGVCNIHNRLVGVVASYVSYNLDEDDIPEREFNFLLAEEEDKHDSPSSNEQ